MLNSLSSSLRSWLKQSPSIAQDMRPHSISQASRIVERTVNSLLDTRRMDSKNTGLNALGEPGENNKDTIDPLWRHGHKFAEYLSQNYRNDNTRPGFRGRFSCPADHRVHQRNGQGRTRCSSQWSNRDSHKSRHQSLPVGYDGQRR